MADNVTYSSFLPEICTYPVFEGLGQEKILDLLSNGRLKGTKHREILYRLGDPAYHFALVLRGSFKLMKSTPRGDDVIMYFSSPGDVLAALIMSQRQAVYPVTVVSMGPSLVLEIPQKTYLEHWARNPLILMKLQNLLFNRMSLLQDQKLIAKSPLNLRVAYLILQLMEKYSEDSERILPIPLTRKEIADAVGSTVESIIRIMSEWSQQGIITTTEKHIEIVSPEKIVDLLKEE